MHSISRRSVVAGAAAIAAAPRFALAADEIIRIGLISSMTGPFAATGRQLEDGVRLFIKRNGDTVAGKKIEIVLKDDAGVADTTRRLAQELIVNNKVNFLAGFTATPGAIATAPVATQAKVPMIVMLAATSTIPDRSPFIVRTSLSSAQMGIAYGAWIADQGLKTMVTLVSDYGPGIDYENFVARGFEGKGGKVIAKYRAPLASPEFAPYVQHVVEDKPDALFIFVPAGGVGSSLMKTLTERGVGKQGTKVFAEGTLLDEDFVDSLGDEAIGYVTTETYSPAHDSATNADFVKDFVATTGRRPNIVAAYAYDGMHLIYEALKKTGGAVDGEKNVQAMLGMTWESPRGPVTVDPQTRDLIQNVYIRRAERRPDGHIWHAEFATIPAVRDPTRPEKK